MTHDTSITAPRLRTFYGDVYRYALAFRQMDAAAVAEVRLQSTLRQAAGFDAFSVARLQNTVRRLRAGRHQSDAANSH